MPTLSKVQRARVVLDLVKDGEVTTLADYNGVELAPVATAMKYAQAFWDAYPHPELVDGNGDPRAPTNEELAVNYLNRLRVFHKEVLAAVRIPAAGETAKATEAATVASEGTTDLLDDEVME